MGGSPFPKRINGSLTTSNTACTVTPKPKIEYKINHKNFSTGISTNWKFKIGIRAEILMFYQIKELTVGALGGYYYLT